MGNYKIMQIHELGTIIWLLNINLNPKIKGKEYF
jgi:hypothetical protein